MKSSCHLLLLPTLVVASLICRVTHGFAPRSGRAVFLGHTSAGPTNLFASVANDGDEYLEGAAGGDDLDKAWLQFQEERSANTKQISLSDFGPPRRDNLFDPQEQENLDTQEQLAVIVSLLVAVGCLVAIYFSGEAPNIVDDPFLSNMEDVDSAEGRFHALTGGVWM